MKRTALRAAPVLAVVAVAGAVVAGSPATAKTTLRIRAVEGKGDALHFSKSKLRTTGGKVTIVMRNPKGNDLPHAVEVEGRGVEEEGKVVRAGGTSRVTVRLKAGRSYEFYCPVGDHEDRGMRGKLVVGG